MYKKVLQQNVASSGICAVQDFCRADGFTTMVNGLLEDIDYLDKSLNEYLDKKRDQFARLYFTSNEELIQLMGNLANKAYLQLFLGKLFEGIAGLIFEDDDIVGFYSQSNEQIRFKKAVQTHQPPEVWLKEVENSMRFTLYQMVGSTLEAFSQIEEDDEEHSLSDWVTKWPGQIMLVVM